MDVERGPRWLAASLLAARAAERQRRSQWDEARSLWERAIGGDRLARAYPEIVARYWLQLGLCRCYLGSMEAAAEALRMTRSLSAGVGSSAEALLLQARIQRSKDPEAAVATLVEAVALAPDDTPILYEICSIAMDLSNPARALPYAARLVGLDPDNMSFRLVAADLAERSGFLDRARRELDVMVRLAPQSADIYGRLIGILGTMGDIAGAREVAIQAGRAMPGEWLACQRLLDIYLRAEAFDHARLICRFLMRRWPHSRWHKLKYAELLARRGDLNAGDRELARFGGNLTDPDYARALWQIAKLAGSRFETLARLAQIRQAAPGDDDAELDYGYALADVDGAQAAGRFFEGLAIRTGFRPRALHAIAHMAVRERVATATLAAWKRAAEIHPDDPRALGEYCRALFEAGQGRRAITLCGSRLDAFKGDRAYVEFYTWLLTAVGRFEDVLAFCTSNMAAYPNSWQLVESGMVAAIFLNRVEVFLDAVLQTPLSVAYSEDVQRLYTLMRLATIVGREAQLVGRFRIGYAGRADHPWLVRLESAAADKARPRGGQRLSQSIYAGSRFEQLVEREAIEAFEALSDPEIDGILVQAQGRSRTIHIFSLFEQKRGGSELHALDLAERLRPYAEVQLWAPRMCHSWFVDSGLVRVVDPWRGDVPGPDGVIVLIGLYFDLGPWLAQAAPYRIVALYNTFEASQAVSRLDAVARWAGKRVELLYCSDLMRDEMGLPGRFEPSPTDLDLFRPATPDARPFTVGRHSRDVIEKHHPEDARVYRAVAAGGGRSRLLGGLCMRETFGPVDGLDLLPSSSTGIAEYLHSLDCFFYRTGTWIEPWGRVVIEAMACGLPVVAHRLGGYAEAIDSGVSGFLFDDTDEAIDQIGLLSRDPDLRRWVGLRARETAERIVGPAQMRRLAAFYLFEPPRPAPRGLGIARALDGGRHSEATEPVGFGA